MPLAGPSAAPLAPLVAVSTLKPSNKTERIRFQLESPTTLDHGVGVNYQSPTMDALGGSWGLKVYLGGCLADHTGCTSAFLEWRGRKEDKPKDMCYLIRVVNQRDPEKSKLKGGPHEKWAPAPSSIGYGWNRVLKMATLFDPDQGYLVDGRVIIEATSSSPRAVPLNPDAEFEGGADEGKLESRRRARRATGSPAEPCARHSEAFGGACLLHIVLCAKLAACT